MNESDCFIKKNGINKCKHKKVGYFTQFSSMEIIKVPSEKPDVEQITSVIVDSEIVSVRIINTPKGVSVEGQSLTGKKLSVEIMLKQKVLYVADVPSQSVHVTENHHMVSTYIIIPGRIKGSKPEDLLECGLLRIEVFVEDIFVEKVDKRTISKNVQLFMEMQVVSTYQLCYTEEYNCTNSNLFITHENGTMKRQLTFYDKSKACNPMWSPSGQYIAYLMKYKETCSLYTVPASNGVPVQVTDTYTFPFISSYCWSEHSGLMYFAAYYEGAKDIFSIDLYNCQWKRLTFGNKYCSSYKPKCSSDGTTIAFLRSMTEEVNIFTVNANGLNTRKLTSSGHVKDFCWSGDGWSIIYVVTKEGCKELQHKSSINSTLESGVLGDSIFIIDLVNYEKRNISVENKGLDISKIKVSPDQRYISFLGKGRGGQNIYIYDLLKESLMNLTNNECDIEVMDYDWDIDSAKIYFSANDLYYLNLYSIELCSGEKTQVSSTNSNGMQVCFRPKLI